MESNAVSISISVADLDGKWDGKGDHRISQGICRKLSTEIMKIGGPEFEATGSFTVKQKWADIHELPGGINFNLIHNQLREDQNKESNIKDNEEKRQRKMLYEFRLSSIDIDNSSISSNTRMKLIAMKESKK